MENLQTISLTQEELKYLLALFNLTFNNGKIGSGDAIQIVNLISKIQEKIEPEKEAKVINETPLTNPN